MIFAGAGTLTEIQTSWSIDDLWDALEALDVKYELEKRAHEEAARKGSG